MAKKKLQVVQNKLIRFLLNLGPRDHAGIEQLNTLGLLNVDDRAKQIRLLNARKVFYKQAPEYIMENFNRNRSRPGMNTKHRAYNFVLPRVMGGESHTFYYNAIKDWNGLLDRLKVCNNFLSFKSKQQGMVLTLLILTVSVLCKEIHVRYSQN